MSVRVRKRHPIMRLAQSHGALGLVHAITIDPSSGKLLAVRYRCGWNGVVGLIYK